MVQFKKTTATVLDASVGTAAGPDTGRAYHPRITYRYMVNGREYVNDRYTQNFVANGSRSAVEKILSQHPPNTEITIFYNVDNPAESFMQKGFGSTVRWILALMLIFSFAALAFALAVSQGWI